MTGLVSEVIRDGEDLGDIAIFLTRVEPGIISGGVINAVCSEELVMVGESWDMASEVGKAEKS